MKFCNKLITAACFFLSTSAFANMPSCLGKQPHDSLLSAFFMPTLNPKLTASSLDLNLEGISTLNLLVYSSYIYGFKATGNRFILSPRTRQNLQTLASWIQQHKLRTKVMLSLGYWSPKRQRAAILDPKARKQFIAAVVAALKDKSLGLSGIDIDWENNFDQRPAELHAFPTFLQQLRNTMNQTELADRCLSVDVPGTVQFAKTYPSPSKWRNSVDWVNVMGYEFYGPYRDYTQLDATLGKVTLGYPSKPPHYPTGSLAQTLEYYHAEGIAKQKLVLIVPFYGDTSYIKNASKAAHYGLHQRVVIQHLAKIKPYYAIYDKYGIAGDIRNPNLRIHQYTFNTPKNVTGTSSFWITKPDDTKNGVYDFLTYPDPIAISETANYVLSKGYLGLSAWTITDDLHYRNKHALLRTLVTAQGKY